MSLERPQWFTNLDSSGAEGFQQLSLYKAMDEELNRQAFRDDIFQLLGVKLPRDDYDSERSS